MKKKFQNLPKQLNRVIQIRFGAGVVAMVVAAFILILAQDFILALPCLLLFVFFICDGGRILYRGITNGYIAVGGQCVKTELSRIRKRVKLIYLQTEKGVLKVPIRRKLKVFTEEDIITVYMSKSARIYEQDGCLVLLNYYAIEVQEW